MSQQAFSHEQFGSQLQSLADIPADETEVLATPHPPFFPSHSSSHSTSTPERFRRPHANSSPPAPVGLYTYACAEGSTNPELPIPPQTFQPIQEAVDAAGPWDDGVPAHGSSRAASGRAPPQLSRLQTSGDWSSQHSSNPSPYDDFPSGSSRAFYSTPGTDSRFASPVEGVDATQHAFFGAGPLSFDPPQQQQQNGAFDSASAQGGAPLYIHPAHLTTLDETLAYSTSQQGTPLPGGGEQGQFGSFGSQLGGSSCAGTPGSAPSSVAPSPHDSTGVTVDTATGIVYSTGPSPASSGVEDPSFGSFASPAASDDSRGSPYLSSPATSTVLEPSHQIYAPCQEPVDYPFDPSLVPTAMEGTAPRPSLSRQRTAPAAFAFPAPMQAVAPPRRPVPLQFPPASSSASPFGPSNPHHRHTPSLPNAATPTLSSFGFDHATPTSHTLKTSLPPSASFPGRHAGHSLSSSFSGSLPGSTGSLSASSSSRTLSTHAHTRHRSLSRPTPYGAAASLRASTGSSASHGAGALAAPFDMSAAAGAAAPPLSRSGSRAGLASEPMSKVYSSPLSEISGRWEGLSLASPVGASGVAGPPWAGVPRSGSGTSLGALVAEEAARGAASFAPVPAPAPGPPTSLAHPTTSLMRVDENGRASLPL